MKGSTGERKCQQCSVNCLFSSLSHKNESEEFNLHKREVTFRKGETIYKQNTFISKIIFIQEGLVKLLVEGTNGKDFIVRFYGRQEYIGLTQIFGTTESRYTVIALKNTRVCMIEISYFQELLINNIGLNEKLINFYADEMDLLYKRLGVLGTKNLHGRLAETLIYLTDAKLTEEDIYALITRKELAELSAMSTESLIRLLNEFKQDNIININGKSIEIENMEMIRILCRAG